MMDGRSRLVVQLTACQHVDAISPSELFGEPATALDARRAAVPR